MRSVQLCLPISVPSVPQSKDAVQRQRRRGLISGRPRRLAINRKVIKVGIRPDIVPRVDRIRKMMDATRPEAVRTAVAMMLQKHPDLTLPLEKPSRTVPVRCEYWKVPFSPEVAATIEELAQRHRITRQKVVNLAIEEMLLSLV